MHTTLHRRLRTSILCLGLVYFTGCVINLKSEKQPTQGIINVKLAGKYPGKNEFNTFDGFYKKEIDKGRYAQSELKLDPGQQLLVLNKAFVYKFFDMPQTFTHKQGDAGSEQHSLRIKADSLDRTVSWSGSIDDLEPKKYQLKELVMYVDSIVKSTESYSGLPKSAITGD